MNDMRQRIASCFRNVFPGLGEDEIARASTASLAAWDSAAHVTLLFSIEEEFGLELELTDFDDLVSYALILNFVEEKSGGLVEEHSGNG
ncbi:MAG: acyl carrier protein familyprotein [Bryobacterales bacterium]|nr:acyl carrier protein familyprotein [Bryobacterales bacterium]